MPLTQQVTIAYTEPQPLEVLCRRLEDIYGVGSLTIGSGLHDGGNGVPFGTIMVEPKKAPR